MTEEKPASRVQNGHLFLSPVWIRKVAQAVHLARGTDPYFRDLATGFSLKLALVIRQIPRSLWTIHGGSQTVTSVWIEKGAVRRIQFSAAPPPGKADCVVVSDYRAAKRIIQGKSSLTGCFLTRQLTVQSNNAYWRRPGLVAKSILAANMVVRIARQVPTVFGGGRPDRKEDAVA